MTRILLVDDEAFFISSLQMYIDWAALDCEVVGIASDGVTALDMAETLRPDLIFLDIQMPRMNGIEVLRRLQASENPARVVMLTGFNQFEYAIQAMRLGAVDYLYKAEMVTEDFSETIRQQQQKITGAPAAGSSVVVARETAAELIRQSIHGLEISKDQAAALKILPHHLFLLTFTIADQQAARRRYGEKMHLLYRGISKILGELEATEKELEVLFYDKHTFCVLKSFSQESSVRVMHRELEYLSRKCIAQLYRFLNLRLYVGISGRHEGFEALSKAFEEAYSAGLLEFSMETNAGHHYETGRMLEILEYLPVEGEKKAFKQALVTRNTEACLRILRNILRCDEKAVAITPSAAKDAMRGMVHPLLEDAALRRHNIRRIEEAASRSGLLRALSEMLEPLMEYCQLKNTSGCSPVVKQAMLHIFQHYTDADLSLERIAAVVGTNPSYLSRTFKQETQIGLTQYINRRRMQAAVELLHQSEDRMIYQIAEEVGYKSVEHFNRVFKQTVGKSPKDYRKDLAQGGTDATPFPSAR